MLQWEEPLALAHQAIETGLFILWELDFKFEETSLEDDVSVMALQLNVRHFCEAVWAQFEQYSVGVALYKGEWQKDKVAYIKSLAALLPDETAAFILIAVKLNAASFFTSINQEELGHLIPILKGQIPEQYPLALPALGWNHGASPLGFYSNHLYELPPSKPLSDALYLTEGLSEAQIQSAIAFFGARPFRVIPENLLSQEWEGIDRLWLLPITPSEKARRQLCGFVAAGGEHKYL